MAPLRNGTGYGYCIGMECFVGIYPSRAAKTQPARSGIAPPPGGNPTIRRTGRDGYACALADPDTIGSAAEIQLPASPAAALVLASPYPQAAGRRHRAVR